MVRLLYITNSLEAYSETFIWNTVGYFDQTTEVKLTIATTKTKSSIQNSIILKEPILMTYSLAALRKIRLAKLAINIFDYWLIRKSINIEYDIVWIDYGDNAVKMFNTFNRLGKKVIVHLHGYDASKLLSKSDYRNGLVSISKNNVIIVPSSYNRNRLILIGCDPQNVHTIPYSYYYKTINKKANISNNNDKMLLFAGRFVEKKDPRILIHVFEEVLRHSKRVKLVMIGDGPLLKEVEDMTKNAPIKDNVILLGAKTHQEVIDWISKADIYVQHCVTSYSGDQEGYPNSILEAQINGLPVVSTIHAGIPEIVVHERTGYLVQEFDFKAMADYVVKLLENRDLRIKMGENARLLLSEKSSPAIRYEMIKQIIHSSIGSR